MKSVVILSLVGLVALFSHGFAMSRLWLWFVVPLGLPAIGIAHGMGLGLFFHFFHPSKADDEDPSASVVVARLLVPLFLVGLGYLIQFFV